MPHFIHWRAIYNDGTYLDALEAEGGYQSIDRLRLVSFQLLKHGQPYVTVHLGPEQKLIWRKREFLSMTGQHDVVHLVGWQQNINGRNIQSILYVFEDGRIEMAGAWKDGHALYGPPKLSTVEIGTIDDA